MHQPYYLKIERWRQTLSLESIQVHLCGEPVRGAAGGTQTPSGGVRDTNGGGARKADRKEQNVASPGRAKYRPAYNKIRIATYSVRGLQIEVQILSSPVLRDDGKDEEDGY